MFETEQFGLYVRALPPALWNTFLITVGALAIGSLAGCGLAVARLSHRRSLAVSARVVIDVGRSIPILVVLYLVYFGMQATVLVISPVVAGILAIGLKLGVYLAEVFRSGIQAVPRGQIEAGYSLGLSTLQVWRRIVLPIALRIMLPALGQYTVATLLDSSFASVIGASDLLGRSRNIIDLFFATELWILVAATYFLMAYPLSRAFALLERRVRLAL